MLIRVLHIWGPDYGADFAGQSIFWKSAYENWSDTRVRHGVFDYHTKSMKDAQGLVRAESSGRIGSAGKVGRLVWAIGLLGFVIKHQAEYDVLHVHTLRWGGLLVGVWADLAGKPAVYESVLEGADNPSSVKTARFGGAILWCVRRFKMVFAISNALAADYRAHGIPVATIPNFVDTTLFAPAASARAKRDLRVALGLPEAARIGLFVGSVKKRKGVDLLLQAFAELAGRWPDLMLLVVGPKSHEESRSLDLDFIQDLYHLLDRKKLWDRVQFTGMVAERRKLADVYRLADLFVFPTRQEGLGNVVLEAAASGLPIVVTDLPEIEDIVQDRVTGLFTVRDDVEGLEKAISLVLDDPAFAQGMAARARAHAMEHFSYDKWQEKITTRYIDLGCVSALRGERSALTSVCK